MQFCVTRGDWSCLVAAVVRHAPGKACCYTVAGSCVLVFGVTVGLVFVG